MSSEAGVEIRERPGAAPVLAGLAGGSLALMIGILNVGINQFPVVFALFSTTLSFASIGFLLATSISRKPKELISKREGIAAALSLIAAGLLFVLGLALLLWPINRTAGGVFLIGSLIALLLLAIAGRSE